MKKPIIMKQKVALIIVVLIIVGQLYGRSLYESHRALHQAERELANRTFAAALPHLTHALRWRAPFNVYASKAESLLKGCALDDACPDQLPALEALRRGITGSRSWLTYQYDLELLEKVRVHEFALIGPAPIAAMHPPRWNPWFQILSQVGLWGWVLSVLFFIWRGFTADGALQFSAGRKYLLSAGIFFCAWLLCLSQA